MAGVKDSIKALVRRLANGLGYDLVGYDGNNPRARLARLLARHRIALVLDVGANRGTFGWAMRELGYDGRIVSFEPVAEAFSLLQQAAKGDASWQPVHLGLGERNETLTINVAANSQSSSFLPMLDMHAQAAPESRYTRQETAQIRRLDEVFSGYATSGDAAFLKIDTQGFEKAVMEGARGILASVPLVQLECSLVPLYGGEDPIETMIGYMRGLGYDPIEALPTFRHWDSGHLMQMDVLFSRRQA